MASKSNPEVRKANNLINPQSKSVKICNILIRLEETSKPFSVNNNHNICIRTLFYKRYPPLLSD